MIADSIAAEVQGYIDGVLSGETVTCHLVRWAVSRHVGDLERQSTPAFPYYFDAHHGAQVCRFFPLFLKHTMGSCAGLPFDLEPWQKFCIYVIFGWKRDADSSRRFRKVYWSMARKNGKALSLDTVLPTPAGFTTMGEVQVGDFLIGIDGKAVAVEAMTDVMVDRPCFEITFSTGEKVRCDEGHEWLTDAKVQLVGCKGKGRKFGSMGESVKTTKAIANSVTYGSRNDVNHTVRLADCYCGLPLDLPVKPYTLGAWLGDGNTDDSRITCGYNDMQIIERIRADGYFSEETKSSNENSGMFCIRLEKKKTRKNGSVRNRLRDCGVLGNKHIPMEYLRASQSDRLELLRGLMDTDGYISPKGQCEFVSIRQSLAEDFKELVCSLGIKATILEHNAKLNGRIISKKYRVYFFAFQPFVPFHLSRKASRVPVRTSRIKSRSTTRQLVECKPIPSVPVKCVTVAGGMYCCTRSFIPTHNSTICAGIAHYAAMADIDPATGKPEAVGQVLLSATKIEQANVVYSEVERMRTNCPALKQRSESKNGRIIYNHNHSFVCKLGSDKPFDGLNPSCVIMDELHAWKERHRKFYDTMVTGSGYRTQPLQLIITTAGDDQSHLWLEEYRYASGVCRGEIEDESLFAFVAELDEGDDPLDANNWAKANPNIDVSISRDYLSQQAKETYKNPSALNRFIRYHCNRIVSSSEKAFDLDEWDKCAGELSDWSTADAIAGGFDLGGRDDLAASAFCARFQIGEQDDKPIWRYEIKAQSYLATDCNRDLSQQPFATWCHYGYIRTGKYPIAMLRDDLLEECGNLHVNQIAYDPYSAQQLGDELQAEGLMPVRMAQNYQQFNEPIKDFMQSIIDKRLRHDGKNPVLRWCAGNAIICRDRNDRWMFDKRDSSEKIDPIVAVVMAFRMCSLAPTRATGSLFVI